jgi:membrane associated rhomboid family serine protease
LVGWLYYFDMTTLWPQYHGSFFCFLAAFLTLLSIPTVVKRYFGKSKRLQTFIEITLIIGIVGLFGEYWFFGKFTCMNMNQR